MSESDFESILSIPKADLTGLALQMDHNTVKQIHKQNEPILGGSPHRPLQTSRIDICEL
jgi:hypothetical protein